jgi:hypothetical protein
MLIIPSVKGCPVCTASVGIIEFSTELIAELAEAVLDPLEWAIILHGERTSPTSARVTHWSVPPQTRAKATVEILEHVYTDDVIGVLHSHNDMQARFSSRDISELNPLYPISVVIGQFKLRPNAKQPIPPPLEQLFGWDYSAVGKIPLPCGELGEVTFLVRPYDADDGRQFEEWDCDGKVFNPITEALNPAKLDPTKLVHSCSKFEREPGEGFTEVVRTACGIVSNPTAATAYFGYSHTLADEIDSLKPPKIEAANYSFGDWSRELTEFQQTGMIVSASNVTDDAFTLINRLNKLAADVNREAIIGINLPFIYKTRDGSYIEPPPSVLYSLVKRLQIAPELLTSFMPLRLWFELATGETPPVDINKLTTEELMESLHELCLFASN